MSKLFNRWLSVFGICLLVVESCQSFFLRHTQTGKCITVSEELVYNIPDHAFPYFVVMTDNCLDEKSQFRYLNSELLHNIEKEGTLVYSSTSTYRARWALYKAVSLNGKRYQNNAQHRLKQTDAGSLFFYKRDDRVCAEPSSQYLLGKTYCDRANQTFTFGSVTAFNASMENVSCSPVQRMVVKSADCGHFDVQGNFNDDKNIDTHCSQLANCQVKSLCGGKTSCELTMNNALLASKYCSDSSKQIYTKYNCVDSYNSSAITTAPNIRLSLTSQSQGFVEIKDGSVWRKVVENGWDRIRQKMLCQHLGFEETSEKRIVTVLLKTKQEIATGDLICYNKQLNGTSCCVHLEPSTTTTGIKVPYVTCQICNSPLLQNENTFPDSTFSGSGDSSNKYEDARITKGGWCPSGSGSAYLLLDLQKEYHITQVVVMADKEQTKWSGSYSINYSVDTSYKNSAQISGNLDGYQASRTSLNIYNVRHVKLSSTGNRNFCLRVEFCGEVQRPAPVSNIIVSPSQYVARLTWEISTSSEDSSFITQIVIYLNNKELQTISRGTEFTLDGLSSNTWYTVGIQTKDGSSQKSQIVKNTFMTRKGVSTGPPLKVTLTSRGKNTLQVSWEAPQTLNGELKGYQVCYSALESSSSGNCSEPTESFSYTISPLLPSTKYTVTVSAVTSAGLGPKSSKVSKITNGEPIKFVATLYYSLILNIPKQEDYIRDVLIIVQSATNNPTSSGNLRTSDLKPYQKNIKDPYVTAYLKANVLPRTFVIGDGKKYNSEKETYLNRPLRQDSNYIVFVRFLENEDSYYSTEWSGHVKTKILAPETVDGQDAKQSSCEKIQMDLLIPLVIFVLCFLLSLGVIIYQRRLIQNFKIISHRGYEVPQQAEAEQTIKSTLEGNNKTVKAVKAATGSDLYMNDEYESPDCFAKGNKQNETESQQELSAAEESSTYMSLKNRRDPENVYQSLQYPNIQTVEYENPTFTSKGQM